MRLGRCPVCHSHVDLAALVQDAAGRELLAELARLDTLSGSAVVMYMALFRSGKRDLANDKTLKLFRELEEIATGDWIRLAIAMQATVEAIRDKQAKGNIQPFTNHNYLKKVLADVPMDVSAKVMPIQPPQAVNAAISKTRGAISKLEEMKRE